MKPYVEPEAALKEAIEKMAESIHLLYSMLRNRETSCENTLQSAKDLEQYAVVLPHTYFISYASDEEEDEEQL